MPSPTPPPPASRRGLARAAALGLCGGMLLGGVMLLVLGLRGLFVPADCSTVPLMECDLLRETSREVGRVQTMCGGALVGLGLSVFVLVRPYLWPRPEERQAP